MVEGRFLSCGCSAQARWVQLRSCALPAGLEGPYVMRSDFWSGTCERSGRLWTGTCEWDVSPSDECLAGTLRK